jgi:photosynthetic reaction center cytochrome c subunit
MRWIVTSAICFAALLAVSAAPLPQGGGAPKNLKVLKPDDVRAAMRQATAGLGVRCDFCHVAGDFAADTIHKKETARQMFEMTLYVNSKVPAVKARVTCYTCHRGATEPLNAPPAAAAGETKQ